MMQGDIEYKVGDAVRVRIIPSTRFSAQGRTGKVVRIQDYGRFPIVVEMDDVPQNNHFDATELEHV